MAKGRIVIDKDNCKGCDLCSNYCPVSILELDITTINLKGYTPMSIVEPEKCIGCGFCAMMCPDSIITVYKTVKEV